MIMTSKAISKDYDKDGIDILLDGSTHAVDGCTQLKHTHGILQGDSRVEREAHRQNRQTRLMMTASNPIHYQ